MHSIFYRLKMFSCRKLLYLFCLLGLVYNFKVLAKQGIIKGLIIQNDDSIALANVSVFLNKTKIGTITNRNGNYILQNIPSGKYTLITSLNGYESQKQEINIEDNKIVEVNMSMQELNIALPEINFVVGREHNVKNIAGAATYISTQELQRFNYTDINRTLRNIPGVNVQEEDGFGLRPNISLRGTGSERSSKITVMEDGILISPAPYTAPAAYYFPTIGRMSGIEILKGSSQIKYGPYTTGGVINLISTAIPKTFSGYLFLSRGSFGKKNLHAYVGNKHKNFGYLVESFQYSSDGFKTIDSNPRAGLDLNSGFDKQDYLAKISVNTNPEAPVYQSLTFKIGRSNELSNETYLGLTESDFKKDPFRRYAASQKDQITTQQTQLSLTYLAEFSKHVSFTLVAYNNNFARNWYKLDAVADTTGTKSKISILDNPEDFPNAYNIIRGLNTNSDDILFLKANNRTYYSRGIQGLFKYNFKTNLFTHRFEFGFRHHKDQVDRFQWIDEYNIVDKIMQLSQSGIRGTESNRVEESNAFSTYLQYQLVYNKLTITPGLRYENIFATRDNYGNDDPERTGNQISQRSNNTDILIPGVGISYNFNTGINAFIGIHRGFAPAGSKENTRPETSINYELGLNYAHSIFSGQIILFFNDYTNLLGSDLAASGGAGTNEQFNGGEVHTQGIELQATFDLVSSNENHNFNLPLSLAYTFIDARFQSDFDSDFDGWGGSIVRSGDQLPYLANNQLSLSISLEHHLFNINLTGRYSDATRTQPGQGEIPNNESTDSYVIIDLSANYNFHKNITFFSNVTNLTNQVYIAARRPAGLRPGLPRSFNIGLKVHF